MNEVQQVSQLLEKWDEARADGREITPEELCRDCPELLPMLKQKIDSIKAIENKFAGDKSTVHDETADHVPDGEPFEFPRSAGRFQIQHEIARGGMGAVMRAVDPEFDRPLAVKISLKDATTSPEIERRFFAEARITGRLQHPGIAPVHEMGRLEDGRPFFAMKLVEGRTLADLLKDNTASGVALAPREIVDNHAAPADTEAPELLGALTRPRSPADLTRFVGIFEQICQTLAYAHSRRVIHRDLKPSNIMVGAFGEVQVMDWGLAKQIGDREQSQKPTDGAPWVGTPGDGAPWVGAPGDGAPADSYSDADPLTQAGVAIGTPAYMSPEQARGEIDQLDEQADVFGLGAILCVILTGKPPFFSTTPGKVFDLAHNGDLTDAFCRLNGCGADSELIDLCKKCLAPAKEDRLRDAAAVAELVVVYQSGVQEKLRQAELQAAEAHVKSVEEKRRRRWMAATGATILLLLAAGTAGAFWFQELARVKEIRQTQTVENARRDLKEMNQARQKAETITDNVFEQRQLLNIAQRAAERFKKQFAQNKVLPPADLDRQFQEESKSLDDAEKDHRLLAAFAKFELESTKFDPEDDQFHYEAAFRAFLTELKVYGLPDKRNFSAQGVDLIRNRPEQMQKKLLQILHTCLAELAGSKQPQADQFRKILDRADPADHWRRQVREAMVQRDTEMLKELSQKADVAQHDAAFLFALAASLTKTKRLAFLQRAQKQYPGDCMINHELGRSFYRKAGELYRGKLKSQQNLELQEAIRHYAAALAVRPDNEAIYVNLGRALHSAKRFPEALQAAEKAIELNANYAKAHYNRGTVLLEMDQYQKAIDAFEIAIKLEPNDAKAHYNRGVALLLSGRRQDALQAMNKAIQINDRYALAYFGRAGLWFGQGEPAKAIVDYQKAAECHPGFSEAWYSLGTNLHRTNKPKAALSAFKKAIVHNPQDEKSYAGASFAFAALGKIADAQAAAKAALHLNQDYANAHGAWGLVLQLKGRLLEAAVSFQRAADLLPPSDPQRNRVRAQSHRLFRQCIASAPKNPNASADDLLILADYCRRNGKLHHIGVKLFEKAFAKQPSIAGNIAKGHRYKAACCAALAKVPDQARVWLQKDLKLWSQFAQSNKPASVLLAAQSLAYWLDDSDLADLFSDTALAKLPPDEQTKRREFRTEIAQILQSARARFAETKIRDNLTAANLQQSHHVKLTAGNSYIFDVTSNQFNAFAYLQNSDGAILALNDDIAPGKNKNSRIIFTPMKTSKIRIVVTSPMEQRSGSYMLIIREFVNRKRS